MFGRPLLPAGRRCVRSGRHVRGSGLRMDEDRCGFGRSFVVVAYLYGVRLPNKINKTIFEKKVCTLLVLTHIRI